MLTYFVARKSYAYYKKQKDDREYKEYVVRQSQAALVDPGARVRKLPPIPGQQDAASSTALVPVTAIEEPESVRVQETTVTTFAPPLPRSRTARINQTAIEPIAQETTTVTVFAPPPSRTNPTGRDSIAQERTTIALRSPTTSSRPPPPPPPKPAALASTPIARPKPPPKPAALSAARVPSGSSGRTRTPIDLDRKDAATPPLPSRSTSWTTSMQLALPSTRTPPTPALPPRMALLSSSDVARDSLRRSNTGGSAGRDAHGDAEMGKCYFGETEYDVKPRAFTPPPVLPTRKSALSKSVAR